MCGLLAPHFFIPHKQMLAFQKVAAVECAKQGIRSLATSLPGFYAWFHDWATSDRRPKNSLPTGSPLSISANGHSASLRNHIAMPPAITPVGGGPQTTKDQPGGRGKRGRRIGSIDPEVRTRDKEMQDDWKAGRVTTRAELGRKHGVDKSYAAKVVKGLLNPHEGGK
jgi:hypothetical protein